MSPLIAAPEQGTRRRFSAGEMLRMMASEIFGEEDRVELVQGEVLTVTPQGPDHRSLKDELHERLAHAYASQHVHVLDQGPGPGGTARRARARPRDRARPAPRFQR